MRDFSLNASAAVSAASACVNAMVSANIIVPKRKISVCGICQFYNVCCTSKQSFFLFSVPTSRQSRNIHAIHEVHDSHWKTLCWGLDGMVPHVKEAVVLGWNHVYIGDAFFVRGWRWTHKIRDCICRHGCIVSLLLTVACNVQFDEFSAWEISEDSSCLYATFSQR